MLVVYFIVFVLLVIAALTANRDGRGSFGRRGVGSAWATSSSFTG